jgi:hypothetical protein
MKSLHTGMLQSQSHKKEHKNSLKPVLFSALLKSKNSAAANPIKPTPSGIKNCKNVL